ncbi:hypothetical protein FA13DRAFT_1738897 [Coprinellus micaceus]|uniref:Uncharacterized protein n=1 Tax=Coprinellus micaceus TaxID=71717 RepID=A0A4Y7SSW1_COPMI|nr:hypothetical protein FA13DRAFT_1738897 [Coprinellus micaceus]
MPQGNYQHREGIFIPWWAIRANRRQKKRLRKALEKKTEEVQAIQGKLERLENEKGHSEWLAKRELEEQREETHDALAKGATLSNQLRGCQLTSEALYWIVRLLVLGRLTDSTTGTWAGIAFRLSIVYPFCIGLIDIAVMILCKVLGRFR